MCGNALLMATRWVGQNNGPIFRHLWPKVHRIKFACVGVSVVCNAISNWRCLVMFQRYLPSSREVLWMLMFWGCQISGRAPELLTKFYISGSPTHHRSCGKVWWWSAKQPQRLGSKKKDLNYSSKTEWPAASIAQDLGISINGNWESRGTG